MLEQDASYLRGNLRLDYVVGSATAATWSTWLFAYGTGVPAWSIALTQPLEPPVAFPVTFPLPSLGTIGVLSFLSDAGGLSCVDFDLVDTGP